METAAKAYLSLIPKLDKSAQSEITSDLAAATKTAGTAAGNDGGTHLSSGLIKSFGVAFAAAGVAAIGTALVNTVKQAVTEYADYEQLVGGIETLFKGSAEAVQQYAANAYQTAGLSANDYMETVTSFSAAMINSLGGDTAKAAEMSNMAITDMADNANKMGTDMERIQAAYSGFSRGNYTMLDNLSLGFAGSKEGMQQLLDKAEEISGFKYDISSYSDIVDAIHVVQTEMGITGTTAEEAATTVSGSVASMQAAWSNWMVGLANDNADMAELTQQLFKSIETVAGNVLPVVSRIAQTILDSLPTWVTSIVQYIVDNAPAMLQAGIHFFLQLVGSIGQSLPDIIAGLFRLIQDMIAYILSPQFLADLAYAGAMLIQGLVGGIGKGIAEFILNIPYMFGQMIDGVMDFFGIHSPSTVFAGIGGYMMDGLALGIEKNATEPQKAMASAMGELANVTTSAAELNVSASTQASAGGIGGITIQNLTVHAEDVLTADKFVSMVRQAAAAY